jgi:hypothetical protein
MTVPSAVDGVLVQWGERLFYPGNRIVRSDPTPRLTALSVGLRAAAVRARSRANPSRPQVIVRPWRRPRHEGDRSHFRHREGRSAADQDDRGVVQQTRRSCATWSAVALRRL